MDDVEDLVEGVGASSWADTGAGLEGLNLLDFSLQNYDSSLELDNCSFALFEFGDLFWGAKDGDFLLESFDSCLGLDNSLGASSDLDVVSVNNDLSLDWDGLDVSESLNVLGS